MSVTEKSSSHIIFISWTLHALGVPYAASGLNLLPKKKKRKQHANFLDVMYKRLLLHYGSVKEPKLQNESIKIENNKTSLNSIDSKFEI